MRSGGKKLEMMPKQNVIINTSSLDDKDKTSVLCSIC